MAVIGKIWTAVIVRSVGVSYVTGLPYTTETLRYCADPAYGMGTTPEAIASYYPDLTWDSGTEVAYDSRNLLYTLNLGQRPMTRYWGQVTTPYYPQWTTDEEAMVDEQSYVEDIAHLVGGRFSDTALNVRWKDGHWRTINEFPYPGSGVPSDIAAEIGATSYNVTTETPFGPYGHGTITHCAHYYCYPDTSYYSAPIAGYPADALATDTGNIPMFSISRTYIFTPYDDGDGGGGGTPGDGEGDGTTDDSVNLRCWGYSLDDHDHYVLRLGPSATLDYDLKTGQWSENQSPGRTNWRAHVGQNWLGMAAMTFARDFGSDVVAGDDASGVLWILDPTYGRDDRSTTGDDKFSRVATSMVAVNGRDTIPCNAVQLTCALGNPSQTGASITLETSDDLGKTWTDHGSNLVVAGDYDAVIEWRGLGLIRAPGRVFRFTDDGATVRFGRAELR